jgi:hypothetical protein
MTSTNQPTMIIPLNIGVQSASEPSSNQNSPSINVPVMSIFSPIERQSKIKSPTYRSLNSLRAKNYYNNKNNNNKENKILPTAVTLLHRPMLVNYFDIFSHSKGGCKHISKDKRCGGTIHGDEEYCSSHTPDDKLCQYRGKTGKCTNHKYKNKSYCSAHATEHEKDTPLTFNVITNTGTTFINPPAVENDHDDDYDNDDQNPHQSPHRSDPSLYNINYSIGPYLRSIAQENREQSDDDDEN